RPQWADCRCDGREVFCQRKRSELAARYGGYVCVRSRRSCGNGYARSAARLFVAGGLERSKCGFFDRTTCRAAIEPSLALSEGCEQRRREVFGETKNSCRVEIRDGVTGNEGFGRCD